MTKVCPKCKECKGVSEFYSDASTPSGIAWYCKTCARAMTRDWLNTPEGYAKHLANCRRRNKVRGPKYRKIYADRYRERFPERHAAVQAIARDIRSGKLTRPEQCSECGSFCAVQAHHDDYSKKRDVRWLCRDCHFKIHQRAIKSKPVTKGQS